MSGPLEPDFRTTDDDWWQAQDADLQWQDEHYPNKQETSNETPDEWR